MRVIRWLDEHLEETILVFFLVLISCVMLLQVFMRKVVNSSFTWPEEFCRYCYVWTGFFSLGYTVRHGNMLRVSVVMDLFPQVVRKVMAILVNIVCLVVFAVFFVNSIDVVQSIAQMGQTSPAMRWPMHLVYLCTVLGFGLGGLRTIQAIYKQVRYFDKEQQSTIEAIKEEAAEEAAMAAADISKSGGV